ncbi:hypothetical protein VNO77_02836 [Canavalia gladiata]|uniref:Uncharacterized protein n=1 Tax=Canavalia gladiata TaxID=3824 RepID=A0AAN9MVR8_CANGL
MHEAVRGIDFDVYICNLIDFDLTFTQGLKRSCQNSANSASSLHPSLRKCCQMEATRKGEEDPIGSPRHWPVHGDGGPECVTGFTTGSNYYVRILNTINRELPKLSASVALHHHSNALIDVLLPEADSNTSPLNPYEELGVAYTDARGRDIQKPESREAGVL